MLRNHSYLPHRYSIRFALFLMTLDTRVHAGGGARGQNLGHLSFQSRTEDLTQNVRAYVLDWVYTSALYTALK